MHITFYYLITYTCTMENPSPNTFILSNKSTQLHTTHNLTLNTSITVVQGSVLFKPITDVARYIKPYRQAFRK